MWKYNRHVRPSQEAELTVGDELLAAVECQGNVSRHVRLYLQPRVFQRAQGCVCVCLCIGDNSYECRQDCTCESEHRRACMCA